jgi:hypothetical protein
MQILYNQVGYLPNENKLFLLQLNSPITSSDIQFKVSNTSTFNNAMMEGNPVYLGYQFNNPLYEIDLSTINQTGNYSLEVIKQGGESQVINFIVSPHCYDLAMERAYEFFYYQRSGCAIQSFISGYPSRPADDLDDGDIVNDLGQFEYRNMSGGWHDAGDFNKYMEWNTNTPFVDLALAMAYESNPTFFKSLSSHYDSSLPDLLDEAIWGADFLTKMTLDDGRVYTNIFSYNHQINQYQRFGYSGAPYLETDNIPNTGDERVIGSVYNTTGNPLDITSSDWRFISPTSALTAACAMLLVANLLNQEIMNLTNPTPYLIRIQSYLDKALGIYSRYNQTLAISTDSWAKSILLLTDLELIQAENNGLLSIDSTLIQNQSTMLFSAILTNMAGDKGNDFGENMIPAILLEAALNLEEITNCSDYIQQYYNTVLNPLASDNNNYFGLTPSGTLSNNWEISEWGNNLGISTNMLINILDYNITKDPTAKSIALNQLNWILGRNPLDICQEDSVGYNNLPTYHSRFISIPGETRGSQPGAIPQGITTIPPTNEYLIRLGNPLDGSIYASQTPYMDLRPRSLRDEITSSFYSNELYITNQAAYVLAFSNLLCILA